MPSLPSSNTRQTFGPLVAAVAFLIILGLVTAGWIVLKEFRVQRAVYTQIMDQNLANTRIQFRLLLEPFSHHLETLVRWQESGLLDLEDPDRLVALIAPLLAETEQVSGAFFFPESGPPHLLVRKDEGWAFQVMAAAELDSLTLAWLDQARSPSHSGVPAWSPYLPLPGDGREGLIISRAHGQMVIALGFLAEDLAQFTASAPITENGFLIRRFQDGTVVWLAPQADNRLVTTDSGELLTSGQPEHAVIGRALMEWGRLERPYHQSFRFKENGQQWWCSFFPSVAGTDPGELGLVAPASDLGGHLETVTGRVTLLLAGLMALAMSVVVTVAFDYRKKWRRFARRRLQIPATENELAALIAGGESDHLEFKSTLRWNLHADKPGKEIELAWLKSVAAYLNTNGGFLIIGVKDDGTVLGTEMDQFKNEDKFILHFDNLIHQHLGLEFAGYLKASHRDLDGKKVFLISCDRCEDPVYLKNGEDEVFYLRVGASTRKLPVSRITDYLRERNQ